MSSEDPLQDCRASSKGDNLGVRKKYEHIAFISYRRGSPRDRRWAKTIGRFIETYRPPRIDTPSGPSKKRLGRVFRDDTDLPALSHELERALSEALRCSQFLLVVCSRASLESPWVRAEVNEFLAGHERSYLVTIMIEDVADLISAAIPPPSGDDLLWSVPHQLFDLDLHAIDDPTSSVATRELIRLAARLMDVSFDLLWQRERRRGRRRWLTGSTVAIASVVAIVVTWWLVERDLQRTKEETERIAEQRDEHEAARKAAEQTQRLDQTIESARREMDGHPARSARLLLDATFSVGGADHVPRLEHAIRDWAERAVRHSFDLPTNVAAQAWSSDGTLAFQQSLGRLRLLTLRDDGSFLHQDIPSCQLTTFALAFSPSGNELAAASITGDTEIWEKDAEGVMWTKAMDIQYASRADGIRVVNPSLDWFDEERLCLGDRTGLLSLIDVSLGSNTEYRMTASINDVHVVADECIAATDTGVEDIENGVARTMIQTPSAAGLRLLSKNASAIGSAEGLEVFEHASGRAYKVTTNQVVALEAHPRGGIVYGTQNGIVARVIGTGHTVAQISLAAPVGKLAVSSTALIAETGFANSLKVIDLERPRRWHYDGLGAMIGTVSWRHHPDGNADVLVVPRASDTVVARIVDHSAHMCVLPQTYSAGSAVIERGEDTLLALRAQDQTHLAVYDLDRCDDDPREVPICAGRGGITWRPDLEIGWVVCNGHLVRWDLEGFEPVPIYAGPIIDMHFSESMVVVRGADDRLGTISDALHWLEGPDVSQWKDLTLASKTEILVARVGKGLTLASISEPRTGSARRLEKIGEIETSSPPRAFAIHPEGSYVAVLTPDNELLVHRADGGLAWTASLANNVGIVSGLSWATDGRSILLRGTDLIELRFVPLDEVFQEMKHAITLHEELGNVDPTTPECMAAIQGRY